MRACWENEMPEFAGDAYRVSGLHFSPQPHGGRRLPVLVGGASAAAFRRAARLGDGWIGDDLSFEELEASLAALRKELEAAGRRLEDVEIAVRAGLQVAEDAEDITGSPSETGWKTEQLTSGGRTSFRGLREQVVADFRRAAELGVNHLVFEFPVSRGEESMYLFETLRSIREEASV
jgi:alkanesulfonate monooxygenase SsuD/methylene tetrahydromethanopterin reductase-like flavin-dependent oxidoreductase (luciferase family)